MTDKDIQPNKPAGAIDSDEARPVEDREAVENQGGSVSPDDYPKNDDGGRPDYGSPKRGGG